MQHCFIEGIGMQKAAVGHAEGYAQGFAFRRAEHGLHKGAVGFKIGGHHQYVMGRKIRIGLEKPQQRVMQHLNLAHGAVA